MQEKGAERCRICGYERPTAPGKIQEEISRASGNAGTVKQTEEFFKNDT